MTVSSNRPALLVALSLCAALAAPGCQSDAKRSREQVAPLPAGVSPTMPPLGQETGTYAPSAASPALESARQDLHAAAHDLATGAQRAAGDLQDGARATTDEVSATASRKAAGLQQGVKQTATRATQAVEQHTRALADDLTKAVAPKTAPLSDPPAPVVELPGTAGVGTPNP